MSLEWRLSRTFSDFDEDWDREGDPNYNSGAGLYNPEVVKWFDRGPSLIDEEAIQFDDSDEPSNTPGVVRKIRDAVIKAWEMRYETRMRLAKWFSDKTMTHEEKEGAARPYVNELSEDTFDLVEDLYRYLKSVGYLIDAPEQYSKRTEPVLFGFHAIGGIENQEFQRVASYFHRLIREPYSGDSVILGPLIRASRDYGTNHIISTYPLSRSGMIFPYTDNELPLDYSFEHNPREQVYEGGDASRVAPELMQDIEKLFDSSPFLFFNKSDANGRLPNLWVDDRQNTGKVVVFYDPGGGTRYHGDYMVEYWSSVLENGMNGVDDYGVYSSLVLNLGIDGSSRKAVLEFLDERLEYTGGDDFFDEFGSEPQPRGVFRFYRSGVIEVLYYNYSIDAGYDIAAYIDNAPVDIEANAQGLDWGTRATVLKTRSHDGFHEDKPIFGEAKGRYPVKSIGPSQQHNIHDGLPRKRFPRTRSEREELKRIQNRMLWNRMKRRRNASVVPDIDLESGSVCSSRKSSGLIDWYRDKRDSLQEKYPRLYSGDMVDVDGYIGTIRAGEEVKPIFDYTVDWESEPHPNFPRKVPIDYEGMKAI